MKFRYEISKLALSDLDTIWHYTAEQWSKQQASKYYKQIFQAINDICSKPEIGKTINEIKEGQRMMNVKSHMIVYKIGNKKILIDRILHQRMDLEAQLNE
ncbi:MAG: type II toxin-antitoxin system RelE/ParE family toxin [Saprospiraceae bacterium]|uniref:Toxin n=1 Tax=Candidatus Opimibacter skivensis TaxID=2982028 RepID=A0A9D7XMD9_9BACT|nr:type II toxin-antitoxin system RelE/ParE family toxin [Candidatus Opimibacter skivensis]